MNYFAKYILVNINVYIIVIKWKNITFSGTSIAFLLNHSIFLRVICLYVPMRRNDDIINSHEYT